MPAPSTLPDSGRIGIVNRGEAALRFIRAAHEFNHREGTSLETVAYYLPQDRDALFVQEADWAFPLTSFGEYAGVVGSAYLARPLLLQALRETRCCAAWVGWGFVSEDADFVRMVEEAGIIFLGPSSRAMAMLGDKIAAKDLAERTDVPIVPWSRGPVTDLDSARRFAEKIGYPCIIKAANAGGGRGIRFVFDENELEGAFRSAVEETRRITGNEVVFIERLVERGRHLEVQVLADRHHLVRTFGVRDCSVQRKNQKIIEETPPPGVDPAVTGKMEAAAARLIKAAGYEGAGTVEFLYDLDRNEFYFMEVNTRLQVEHPITEQLYGIDLVRGQLLVARGGSIKDFSDIQRGHVIEVRLNAEDPDRGFRPSPGRVVRYKIPSGPGIRVDSGIEQGSTIPAEFDSMVAKIIAAGSDRSSARARLARALEELRIKIEGGTTNRAFVLELLDLPEIRAGGVHTRFVEQYLSDRRADDEDEAWAVALVAAAIEQYLGRYAEDFANFSLQLSSSAFPREVGPARGYETRVSARSVGYKFHVESLGGDRFRVLAGKAEIGCRYEQREHDASLEIGARRHHIQLVERGDVLQVEVDGRPFAMELDSGGTVKAPSPALVLSIPVREGQPVAKGDILVTLEAMKMEMVVSAPEAGVVKAILIKVGEQVAAGRPLVELESRETSEEAAPASTPVDFSLIADPAADAGETLQLDALFLGYDCASSGAKLLERLVEARGAQDRDVHEFLVRCVETYAAVEKLFSLEKIAVDGFARPASMAELTGHFFKRSRNREKGMPEAFLRALERCLRLYGVGLKSDDRVVKNVLFRVYRSHALAAEKGEFLVAALAHLLPPTEAESDRLANSLDELAVLTQTLRPAVADAAINARYRLVDRRLLESFQAEKQAKAGRILDLLLRISGHDRFSADLWRRILDYGHSVVGELVRLILDSSTREPLRDLALEVIGRWMNRDRTIAGCARLGPTGAIETRCETQTGPVVSRIVVCENVQAGVEAMAGAPAAGGRVEALIIAQRGTQEDVQDGALSDLVGSAATVTVGSLEADGSVGYQTWIAGGNGAVRSANHLDLSPLAYRELRVFRFANFDLDLRFAVDGVRLVRAVARSNPRDERLFVLVDVPNVRFDLDSNGYIRRMVGFDSAFMQAVNVIREEQLRRKHRLHWNRIVVHIRRVLDTDGDRIRKYAKTISARALDLGMEKIVIYSRMPDPDGLGPSPTREVELVFENLIELDLSFSTRTPSTRLLEPFDTYVARVVRCRQRNTVYPYELVKMLLSMDGEFEEFDLAEDVVRSAPASVRCRDRKTRRYASVRGRPFGLNTGNIVFGLISNRLSRGRQATRVIILSDPTSDLGSLAEAECLRVNAALDLADDRGVPVEWIPISAGARIDMDSGTENLDWTACTLRRIIEYTQAGGELNIIVNGINVGAQSYWNAEATMLMHTRGLLIMTEDAGILLTGKKALDFSGSVSAEDNLGIGGVEKIMEPNGQAQLRAKNLREAYEILFRHYELTCPPPGKTSPDPVVSSDPPDRDVGDFPYRDALGQGFATVGDIFSRQHNPERKKPFDIRQVMRSVTDQDLPVLERWTGMADGETAAVWECRIGGRAAGLIGIESRPLVRQGEIPHDGPESWSGGTLFPLSSKKVARGINAFSGRLPLVILANLSGFDGSPESLRKLQLEYGAEIGRAVVNFKGSIVFVVIARYHGGAYVVFSKSLNSELRAAALEGAYASVIGGAPAAAVVFPAQVLKESHQDERVVSAARDLKEGRITQAAFDELWKRVHSECQAGLAARFDAIHSVDRAKSVGSIDDIIDIHGLRPYIIGRLTEN